MADACVDVSCTLALPGRAFHEDYIEVEGKESLASDLLASSEAYEGEFSFMVRDLDVTMYGRGSCFREKPPLAG
nr:hypothetical protein [Tanacetum cinerariifolium]